MKIKLQRYKDVEGANISKVVMVFEDTETTSCDGLKEILRCIKEEKHFSGKKNEIYTLTNVENNRVVKSILIGLGEYKHLSIDLIRNVSAKVMKEITAQKITNVAMYIDQFTSNTPELIKAMTEAILMSAYRFDKYKSEKVSEVLKEVTLVVNNEADINVLMDNVKEGHAIAEGNLLARELVNEPANILTPAELAERTVTVGKNCGFEVEIFDRKEIENLEMEAFISVGKGSANEPKLIVMRYMGNPEDKNNILGFVGKGLTFDAGGYCLKTAPTMWQMKTDMGGAGAVIGAMSSIAKMKIKKNVIAVVAACENLISGTAYRPGDIINTMNGKTIEILNTDAEGRLTLADAVTYIIRREGASKIIDIATLTGAVGGALGNVVTGVVSNNDELYSKLEAASKKCDEKVWRFPAFDEYKALLKGNNADLANITAPVGGGAITAGLFVGEFVEEKPWVHLDIAATAFSEGTPNKEYFTKGATGIGSRLLYELAKID